VVILRVGIGRGIRYIAGWFVLSARLRYAVLSGGFSGGNGRQGMLGSGGCGAGTDTCLSWISRRMDDSGCL